MYENSVKVPFIMSHTGDFARGRVTEALVSQYDFMLTLLDYLGLETPEDPLRPGRSFLPVLLGETNDAQDGVVIFDEYGPVRMIRTQEWKYVHRYPYGPHELYDLVVDPDERKNLVDEKSKQALVKEMRQQLAFWFSRYVLPELNGTRFQVTGQGHATKIGPGYCGEGAFHPLPEDWTETRTRLFQPS